MTLKNKTIIQILPSLKSGGVERGTIDIALELAKNDANAIIISSGGSMISQIKNHPKITHIKINVASKNPIIIIANIFKICQIIKKYRANLIHVRSRAPAISAYFASKISKVPLIATIHGPYSIGNPPFDIFKKFYNSFMLRADKIIAVSNFILNYIKENYDIDERKISVINRGVDLNYFNLANIDEKQVREVREKLQINKKNNQKIIALPARYTNWKGHNLLIDAISQIKRDDFLCLFFGSDHGHENYKKRLQKKVKEMNLDKKIKIFGNVKNMPAALSICDIVISASIKPEAFGRVAIEAGAMGKIVIATKIGGSLHIINDGENGFLVDYKNCNQLKEKIEFVLDMNENERTKISKNAQKNIKDNFSNQQLFTKTLNIYKALL